MYRYEWHAVCSRRNLLARGLGRNILLSFFLRVTFLSHHSISLSFFVNISLTKMLATDKTHLSTKIESLGRHVTC